MARRLIGTDTTGTDGSVSIPYTGTGAGLVQMDVETEIDGSIVSVPCNVLDALFYFDGVTQSQVSRWHNTSSVSIDVQSDGTVFSNSESTNKYIYADTGDTGDVDFTPPFAVEFDVSSLDGTCIFRLDNGTNGNRYLAGFGSGNEHFKIEVTSTQFIYYNDNGEIPSTRKDHNGGKCDVGFIVNNGSFKFTNFKIYSI